MILPSWVISCPLDKIQQGQRLLLRCSQAFRVRSKSLPRNSGRCFNFFPGITLHHRHSQGPKCYSEKRNPQQLLLDKKPWKGNHFMKNPLKHRNVHGGLMI